MKNKSKLEFKKLDREETKKLKKLAQYANNGIAVATGIILGIFAIKGKSKYFKNGKDI